MRTCSTLRCTAGVPGLFSLSSLFARGESVCPFSEDFPVSLQGSTVGSKRRNKRMNVKKNVTRNTHSSTGLERRSLLGEFWLDDSSVCFKASSLGLADGSVLAQGDSVLFLSSPVLSSEPPLLSSLSAAFSGTDAGSDPEVC